MFSVDRGGAFLKPEQIRTLMEKRLISGGYTYKVHGNKQIYKDIRKKIRHKVIGKSEVEDYLKKLYFQKSHFFGRDNFRFHTQYFIESIQLIRGRQIIIRIPESAAIPHINQYDNRTLLLLHAVFLHKHLTLEAMEAALLFTRSELVQILSRLRNHGFVEKTRDIYMIAPKYYNQLYDFLAKKNLVREMDK